MEIFWHFVAGLGLFLYAISLMETALQALSGDTIKHWLRNATGNLWSAVGIGAACTAILQSSSMVGLILLAFVGAKLLPLYNAIGVIIGANIGTTVTGWLVTTLGFKLSLQPLAFPLLGLGSLLLVLNPNHLGRRELGRLLLGFGMLLFGLDNMKSATEFLSQQVDVAWLQGHQIWVFLIAGLLLTVVIQSSSAAMMITLSALHVDMLTLPQAATFIIGADIGTTSTIALGAIGSNWVKRQVAVAHIIFNLFTGLVAFALLYPQLWLIQQVLQIHDPLYALVAYHTGFNLLGILLFMPQAHRFARWLERTYVHPTHDNRPATQLLENELVVPEAALTSLQRETRHVAGLALMFAIRALKLARLHPAVVERFPPSLSYAKRYRFLKQVEGEIVAFAHALQQQPLTPEQSDQLRAFLDTTRHAVFSAKALRDIRKDVRILQRGSHQPHPLYESMLAQQQALYLQLARCHRQSSHGESSTYSFSDMMNKVKRQFADNQQHILTHYGHFAEHLSTLLNMNRELRTANEQLISVFIALRAQSLL